MGKGRLANKPDKDFWGVGKAFQEWDCQQGSGGEIQGSEWSRGCQEFLRLKGKLRTRLPSGGGRDAGGSLQPGQAGASAGCRELVASGWQGVRAEVNADGRSGKEAGSPVHTSDG